MRKLRYIFLLAITACALFLVVGCGEKITLSFAQGSYEVEVGKELQLTPDIKNPGAKEYELKYSFEDPEIATYINGVVKGIAVGQTTVKVELEGNAKVFAEATITVKEATKYTITFDIDGGSSISPV